MIKMRPMKFLCVFVCGLLFLCSLINSERYPCSGAKETLDLFETRLNNIKPGNAFVILLKNFYCPACTHYLGYWQAIQNEIEGIEGDKLTMITFDCACPLISPYCSFFDVEFYPTFRVLYAVNEMNQGPKNVKYINKGDLIAKTKYDGSFTLTYKEVERMKRTIDLQKMLQLEVCPQMITQGHGLISCLADLEKQEEEEQMKKRKLKRISFKSLNENINEVKEDKWTGIPKKEDIQHDIIKGLLHTIKQNVSMGKEVTKESLETLIVMLRVVGQMYPNTEESINALIERLNGYTYPIKYDTWLERMKNLRIHEYELNENNNFNFKVCKENSLFCAFWLLYHKISVYCYQHDDKNFIFYKNLILEYTKKYLNCGNCIEHFSKTYSQCYFGACNVHSAPSLVIFLWRTHNAVTLRTTCEALQVSGNNNSPSLMEKIKYVNKDIAFPSKKQCGPCREGYGFTKISKFIAKDCEKGFLKTNILDAVDAFNILNTLRFLLNYFGP